MIPSCLTLGLELVSQLAKRGWIVFASARDPSASSSLSDVIHSYPDTVIPLALDVTSDESIEVW